MYDRFMGTHALAFFGSCSPKVFFLLVFLKFKCQNCRDLRAFLRVKFGSTVLLCAKELTFCNSSGNPPRFLDPLKLSLDSWR